MPDDVPPFNATHTGDHAMPEQSPRTAGFHHIGLAVRDLDLSSRFFRECLGWRITGEKPNHPAISVTTCHSLVTL